MATNKCIVMLCLLVVVCPVLAQADGISWFAGENWLCYASGYPNVLPGHISDPTVGCFVQLLWVGPNGVIDPAYFDGGDGTGPTDDLVVSKIWVGYGVGEDGYFNAVELYDGDPIIQGRTYFARVWNAPSPNYAAGKIPTGPGVQYANSPTWVYPKIRPTFDDFDITYAGDLNTTLTPIPEPAALALVACGLLGLRLTRKKA